MIVSEIMTSNVRTCAPENDFAAAAKRAARLIDALKAICECRTVELATA